MLSRDHNVFEKNMYGQVCCCFNCRIQLCSGKYPWLLLYAYIKVVAFQMFVKSFTVV